MKQQVGKNCGSCRGEEARRKAERARRLTCVRVRSSSDYWQGLAPSGRTRRDQEAGPAWKGPLTPAGGYRGPPGPCGCPSAA